MSKILIINPILYTAETNRIPKVSSIKDTMIYALCMGFVHGGHKVTLIAAQDYRPLRGRSILLRFCTRRLYGTKFLCPDVFRICRGCGDICGGTESLI